MGLKYKGSIIDPQDVTNKNYADWFAGKFTVMPTPVAGLLGKVCQYIGTTTTVEPIYIHGCFYECIVNTSTPITYKWGLLSVIATDELTTTIIENKVAVKDEGITYDKVNANNISQSINETTPSTTKFVTENATKEYVMQKVNFVYTQGSAESSWVINHNLKYFPNVTVIDSAGSRVIGDITYTNENSLTLTFSSAMTGKAYLS